MQPELWSRPAMITTYCRKTKSNYLLSTAREEAKEHKHNYDDDDDPKDSADRKKHSERCKHPRLQVGVSVSSLLVPLRNESSPRAVVARLFGRKK
jgi:hypothetical protein